MDFSECPVAYPGLNLTFYSLHHFVIGIPALHLVPITPPPKTAPNSTLFPRSTSSSYHGFSGFVAAWRYLNVSLISCCYTSDSLSILSRSRKSSTASPEEPVKCSEHFEGKPYRILGNHLDGLSCPRMKYGFWQRPHIEVQRNQQAVATAEISCKSGRANL